VRIIIIILCTFDFDLVGEERFLSLDSIAEESVLE